MGLFNSNAPRREPSRRELALRGVIGIAVTALVLTLVFAWRGGAFSERSAHHRPARQRRRVHLQGQRRQGPGCDRRQDLRVRGSRGWSHLDAHAPGPPAQGHPGQRGRQGPSGHGLRHVVRRPDRARPGLAGAHPGRRRRQAGPDPGDARVPARPGRHRRPGQGTRPGRPEHRAQRDRAGARRTWCPAGPDDRPRQLAAWAATRPSGRRSATTSPCSPPTWRSSGRTLPSSSRQSPTGSWSPRPSSTSRARSLPCSPADLRSRPTRSCSSTSGGTPGARHQAGERRRRRDLRHTGSTGIVRSFDANTYTLSRIPGAVHNGQLYIEGGVAQDVPPYYTAADCPRYGNLRGNC